MPRSASQSPDDALQGNLFGAPEPARRLCPPASTAAASHDLSDDELGADAAARPRQRQPPQARAAASRRRRWTTSTPSATNRPGPTTAVWIRCSSPRCCAYVELKAAHPERVLLYRLGDFFECFEDAIELSRVLERPSPARRGARPSAGCRWRGSPPCRRALLRRTDQAGLQRRPLRSA